MKKFISKIHLWISLPFGLVVTVICLSGAALVFEGEITRALHPKLYHTEVPADACPLPPSQLAVRIGGQLSDTLHLASLQLTGRPDGPCMVSFRETGRKQLSVDPYTGDTNGWTESPAFFGTMRRLHRWLLDPPTSKVEKSVGKVIVGVSTLALVVILLSGLILWIPRSRKALRNRLKVSCAEGRHRFWHDCHVSLGFYAAFLLLVMALTGLTWSFGWYRTVAYALFGGAKQTVVAQDAPARKSGSGNRKERESVGERTERRTHGNTAATPDESTSFDYAVWDEVLAQLAEHYPSYKTIVLTPTEAQIVRQSVVRRTDRATFDPRNGRLGEIVRYEESPRPQRLRGWFYAIHTGSWGGIWTKLLYFLAALVGGTLPLTGYWLWWKRCMHKSK